MTELLSHRLNPGYQARALFQPRSLVLVTDPAQPEAAILAANIAAGGFVGAAWVVGMTVAGLQPVDGIAALPEAPDLAVLSLPPAALEPAMAALARRGCFAAIMPGPAPGLAAISARTGVRALGQGSFGLCIPALGLNASLSHLAPRPGRLALVGQSSALARAVLDWAEAEAVGFSHVIGIGGNADSGLRRGARLAGAGRRDRRHPARSAPHQEPAGASSPPPAPRPACGRWWRSAPACRGADASGRPMR